MKKLLVFAVIAGGLALASCKKNHTCSCTTTALGITITTDTVFQDMSKSDAEAACTGLNIDAGTLGSVSCELK